MNKPSTKPATLSTVYLDNQRIGLMGDPRPPVAKIVAAAGQAPDAVHVLRSRSPDSAGTPVRLDDVVDRTADPTKAIYLTCRPKARADVGATAAPSPQVIAVPLQETAPPEIRGPLPAQPAPVPPRPDPPEWGL